MQVNFIASDESSYNKSNTFKMYTLFTNKKLWKIDLK